MFRSDYRRDALETAWKKALKMLRPPLKATSPNGCLQASIREATEAAGYRANEY